MTNPIRSKTLLFICAISLVGLLAAPVWGSETWHNMPGTACSAFNNAQANMLQRSHVRIYNPPSNPNSLWVICPIQRVAEDVQSTTDLVWGYINTYFSNQSATSAEVTCIVREFEYDTIHVAGGTTTGLLNSVVINIPRPMTVPAVNDYQFDFTNDYTGNYYYWTATCKLPPGTGINSVDFRQQ